MLEQIEHFAQLLRRGGVRVSTAEVLDASRAVAAIDLGQVPALRAALCCSLIKRGEDRALFDELFELYFLRRGELSPGADESEPADLSRALAALAAQAAEMSAAGRTALGLRDADPALLVQGAGIATELSRMSSPLQIGHYTYRLLDALGLDAGEREALAAVDRARAAEAISDAEHGDLVGLVRRQSARVRQLAREHVRAEYRRQSAGRPPPGADAFRREPLSTLDASQHARVREELARLAHVFRARRRLRPRARSGRFDLRRTLRRSLATGGVPFEIEHVARRPRKPRLVILCDVSDSVSAVSRFMLELVYALQDLWSGVRSFAFVAEIGELTSAFRRSDASRAVDSALAGEVVNVFASSNYGAVLADFCERHAGLLDSRTTLLVIGDGRGNYHPPRADLLADLRRRARRVVWLCPEAPPSWSFGDSAMRDYEPHCDEVAIARDLDGLRAVVDDLLRA